MNNLTYEMHALLNEMFENAIVFLINVSLILWAALGPLLTLAIGIWIALWLGEQLLGVIPLAGKPLSKIPKKLRELYTKGIASSVKFAVDLSVKLVISFFGAVARGALFLFTENRPPTRRPPPRDQ